MRLPPADACNKLTAAISRWWRKRHVSAYTLVEQADLLPRRMAALGLDADTVVQLEPVTFRDLQRLCTTCECHELCEWDLRQDPTNPAWQDYCPNSATLGALGSLPWFVNEWRAPWALL